MGAQLCVRLGRLPMRTTISNIENIVRAFVMVTPMLGVKLLSVYEVKIISEGDSDVYENYYLTGNHIAPLTLGYIRFLVREKKQ